MSHRYSSSFFHLVWATKDRFPFITPELASKLYPYIGGIARNIKCELLIIGGMPDHVHLLITVHPTVSIAELVKKLKANATRFVREQNPQTRFEWQPGYGSFSVSVSMLETVKNYIAKQEEHHKKGSFAEEFLALLEKHGLRYDDHFGDE